MQHHRVHQQVEGDGALHVVAILKSVLQLGWEGHEGHAATRSRAPPQAQRIQAVREGHEGVAAVHGRVRSEVKQDGQHEVGGGAQQGAPAACTGTIAARTTWTASTASLLPCCLRARRRAQGKGWHTWEEGGEGLAADSLPHTKG